MTTAKYDPDADIDWAESFRNQHAALAEKALAEAQNEKCEREPGCLCQWEPGDSPCPVHGEDEP